MFHPEAIDSDKLLQSSVPIRSAPQNKAPIRHDRIIPTYLPRDVKTRIERTHNPGDGLDVLQSDPSQQRSQAPKLVVFVCDREGCGEVFNRFYKLLRHKEAHLGREMRLSYECDVCSESFRSPQDLELHQHRHEPTLRGLPRAVEADIGHRMGTTSVASMSADDSWRKMTVVSMDDPFVRSAAEALSGLENTDVTSSPTSVDDFDAPHLVHDLTHPPPPLINYLTHTHHQSNRPETSRETQNAARPKNLVRDAENRISVSGFYDPKYNPTDPSQRSAETKMDFSSDPSSQPPPDTKRLYETPFVSASGSEIFNSVQAPESTTDGDLDWWSEGSSCDSYTQQTSHATLDLSIAVASKLLNSFSAWYTRGGAEPGASQSQDSNSTFTDSSNASNSNSGLEARGSGRYKILTEKRRPNDEEEDQRPTKGRKVEKSTEQRKCQLLACPFAKNNPIRHSKCHKYMIAEIHRLKNHLLRIHQVPIHCARCNEIFDNEEFRDDHQRNSSDCTVQPSRHWDGVSESQRRLLSKRVSSKKTREENWYLIYQILFPGQSLPESPYMEDTELSEELLAFQEFARQEAPSLISDFALNEMPPELRATQSQVEEFALAAFRRVLAMVLERCSKSASSPTDSGYVSNERQDANLPSFRQESVTQETTTTRSEGERANLSCPNTTFRETPNFQPNFCCPVETVVRNFAQETFLGPENSMFDFLNDDMFFRDQGQ